MDTSTNGKHRGVSATERAPSGLRLYAQLGLRIPEELATRLKAYCRASGQSVNRTVMDALARYLTEKGR